MPLAGMSDAKRLEVAESTCKEMEALARRMRELIAAQPPLDLLGYIYGQRLLMSLPKSDASPAPDAEDHPSDTLVDDTQFALEYLPTKPLAPSCWSWSRSSKPRPCSTPWRRPRVPRTARLALIPQTSNSRPSPPG
jgi:hypothetical protein